MKAFLSELFNPLVAFHSQLQMVFDKPTLVELVEIITTSSYYTLLTSP